MVLGTTPPPPHTHTYVHPFYGDAIPSNIYSELEDKNCKASWITHTPTHSTWHKLAHQQSMYIQRSYKNTANRIKHECLTI